MKRLAVLLALSTLLAACGRAASTPVTVREAGPGVSATTPAAATRVYATATTAVTPTPIPQTPAPTSAPRAGPLPFVVATIALGEAQPVCSGSLLAVDPATGHLYTAGVRAIDAPDAHCLSEIDPATGQVLQTRDVPFEPHSLQWDSGTLYVIGRDQDRLVVADASTGAIVAQESTGEEFYNEQIVVYQGWVYAGLPGNSTLGLNGTLYLIPLRDGTPLTIFDANVFDVADDGRIAVASGQAATIVRVYAGTGGLLLTQQEVGPGQPGPSLAFDGRANRIFVTRQQAMETITDYRYFVDVLDASSLEPVNQAEEWAGALIADPGRGRVYAYASAGRILGFDATSGELVGTLFNVPQGEPAGFTMVRGENMRVDPASGRVTVVYEDFDGSSWMASFDPATGEGQADVQVPGNRWALDGTRGRLYSASRDVLLALDAATLRPVGRMALSHTPVSAAVAPDGGYLLVGDAGGDVHALDRQTHAEVRLLAGVGGYVDVDLAHGWLYAGDEYAAGVSVYDLATLERRGLIPQPGRPTASPADGRVYILEEDVYTGDGATLSVIEGRTGRHTGCNGCTAPTGVIVDPRSGRTHVTTYGTWVGKPGPTSHVALDPLTGHTAVALTTGGYRVRYTLAAYADLTLEQALAWRDGLYGLPLYNPASGHLYLAEGARLLVLDGQTLDLVGWLYPSEEPLVPAAADSRSGRVYLLAGPQVLVLEGSGGRFETPLPRPATRLPGPAEGIVPVPDEALFVRAYDREGYTSRLYRSTNGGQTWEEVRGGLPGAPNDLAVAPDGTLYAAAVPCGWHAETAEATWGEGVYRSDDGGDTWRPFSQGLVHLRVSRIHADADGQAYVLATGTWPEQPDRPVPTIWRLDRDGHWTHVEVPEAGPSIGADGMVAITYTQASGAAWHTLTGGGALYRSWGSELQRSADGGVTWTTVGRGPVDYGTAVLTGLDEPPALYWLTWDAVYRSTDEGVQWARFSHPALANRAPSAVTVAEWGGEETLFVGTDAGELLVLPVAQADWRTEGTTGY